MCIYIYIFIDRQICVYIYIVQIIIENRNIWISSSAMVLQRDKWVCDEDAVGSTFKHQQWWQQTHHFFNRNLGLNQERQGFSQHTCNCNAINGLLNFSATQLVFETNKHRYLHSHYIIIHNDCLMIYLYSNVRWIQ